MIEEELVKKFVESYKQENSNRFIADGSGNQSTYADCELVYNNEYIKLEAKTFNDTRSNSNNFYKMFTQILINRNLQHRNKDEALKCNKINYGFLFNEKDICYVKEKLNNIKKDDIIKFSKSFDLKYIFIYKEQDSYEIKLWKNFIKECY